MSYSKNLSNKIFCFIEQQHPIENPDKIRYGLDYLCASGLKIAVLLLIGFSTGFLIEVIVCMLSFGLFRQYSGGIHMPTSVYCLYAMITIYYSAIGISYFVNIPQVFLIAVAIFSLMSVLLYAPADTLKHPIVGPKHRRTLRVQSILACLIGILVAAVMKGEIAELIMISFLIQSSTLLPIAYKITKQERRQTPCERIPL